MGVLGNDTCREVNQKKCSISLFVSNARKQVGREFNKTVDLTNWFQCFSQIIKYKDLFSRGICVTLATEEDDLMVAYNSNLQ